MPDCNAINPVVCYCRNESHNAYTHKGMHYIHVHWVVYNSCKNVICVNYNLFVRLQETASDSQTMNVMRNY